MISDSELLIDTMREVNVLKDENIRLKNWIYEHCDAKERLITCDSCLNSMCPLIVNEKYGKTI